MPGVVGGATIRIWSAPTPKRRSPSRRISSGPSTSGACVASSTTKSLPAPCILVKRTRVGEGSMGQLSPRAPLSTPPVAWGGTEEHTPLLQSPDHLLLRLLL